MLIVRFALVVLLCILVALIVLIVLIVFEGIDCLVFRFDCPRCSKWFDCFWLSWMA